MGILNIKPSNEGTASNILDEYSNKVFRLVVMIVPIFFMCGNGTMTIIYYLGFYNAINPLLLWCANCVDI